MTLGHSRVLGWNGRQEKLEGPDEPIGVNIDFDYLLHLELLMEVCAAGVGSEMFEIEPSEESLDKFTRLSKLSSFTECNRGGWILDIFEGCNVRLVDAAVRAALSPNAL
jgi:hypothetical protein